MQIRKIKKYRSRRLAQAGYSYRVADRPIHVSGEIVFLEQKIWNLIRQSAPEVRFDKKNKEEMKAKFRKIFFERFLKTKFGLRAQQLAMDFAFKDFPLLKKLYSKFGSRLTDVGFDPKLTQELKLNPMQIEKLIKDGEKFDQLMVELGIHWKQHTSATGDPFQGEARYYIGHEFLSAFFSQWGGEMATFALGLEMMKKNRALKK